jgi:hypothetical protein
MNGPTKDFVSVISVRRRYVPTTELVLFVAYRSWAAVTTAPFVHELVSATSVAAVAVTATEKLAPPASEASVQVRDDSVQFTPEVAELIVFNVKPAGSESVTDTFVAGTSRVFVTVTVHVAAVPEATGPVVPVFTTATSGSPVSAAVVLDTLLRRSAST